MKIERPFYVKEGYMPNISWGTGNLPSIIIMKRSFFRKKYHECFSHKLGKSN
jgi:hypothetical protein